jgi:hypothetical protein
MGLLREDNQILHNHKKVYNALTSAKYELQRYTGHKMSLVALSLLGAVWQACMFKETSPGKPRKCATQIEDEACHNVNSLSLNLYFVIKRESLPDQSGKHHALSCIKLLMISALDCTGC